MSDNEIIETIRAKQTELVAQMNYAFKEFGITAEFSVGFDEGQQKFYLFDIKFTKSWKFSE